MKTLMKSRAELNAADRWDIDYHLPPEGILAFSPAILRPVHEVAYIAPEKRDPTAQAEEVFSYIDIASVDVSMGMITSPQEVIGEEAPSRARKVVRAFDIVISTVRPTRGAIAVVPAELHNQIASTGFSVLRAHEGTNPLYLHFALRLKSTLEQFRKWSTGSSYPAILDPDVLKTMIPFPPIDEQDAIAEKVMSAFNLRDAAIRKANSQWERDTDQVTTQLASRTVLRGAVQGGVARLTSSAQIAAVLEGLPPLTFDRPGRRRGRGPGADQLDLGAD